MKVLNHYYDEDTGESFAEVVHMGVLFIGKSTLLEEDYDIKSKFVGCNFAELKAIRKAFKYEKKELRKKLLTLKEAYQQASKMKGFNPKEATATHLRKQIGIKTKKLEALTREVENLESNYLSFVEKDLAYRRKLAKNSK